MNEKQSLEKKKKKKNWKNNFEKNKMEFGRRKKKLIS